MVEDYPAANCFSIACKTLFGCTLGYFSSSLKCPPLFNTLDVALKWLWS